MTEADILALTYQDSCWVYRPQKTTLPSGESVFQKGWTAGRYMKYTLRPLQPLRGQAGEKGTYRQH